MRIYFLNIFTLLLVNAFSLNAANYPYKAGAKAAGTGFTQATFPGHWSIFYNPAAITGLEGFSAGGYIVTPHGMQELTQGAFAAGYGFSGNLSLAAGAYFMGNEYFSEQRYMFAIARTFHKIKAGIQFNLFNTYNLITGNELALVGDAGIIYEFNNKLEAGFHIFNPSLSRASAVDGILTPVIITISSGYELADNLKAMAEINKQLKHPLSFQGGIDYQVNKLLSLRSGVVFPDPMPTFGAGITLDNIEINFAFTTHRYLGLSPHASFDYRQNVK